MSNWFANITIVGAFKINSSETPIQHPATKKYSCVTSFGGRKSSILRALTVPNMHSFDEISNQCCPLQEKVEKSTAEALTHEDSDSGFGSASEEHAENCDKSTEKSTALAHMNEGVVQASRWIMPLENHGYIKRKYNFCSVVGNGNFAAVYKCVSRKTGRLWAIKQTNKQKLKSKEQFIENEVEILCQCKHPNIIKLAEAYQTPHSYYMVLELLEYGDLFDAIKNNGYLPEHLATQVVRDTASALHYLHSNAIVHRDIKPENLLLTSDFHIKLADFGLACKMLGPLYRVCGTPTYVAPEILAEQTGYGVPVDMWSLGIITYIMLCGYAPFRNPDKEGLFVLIQAGRFSFQSPGWSNVSQDAKNFVASLLQSDPAKRMTAKDVLHHSWVTQLDGVALHHDQENINPDV